MVKNVEIKQVLAGQSVCTGPNSDAPTRAKFSLPTRKSLLFFVGLLALSAARGRLQNIRQKKNIKNGQAWDEVERRDVTRWVQCPKQHQPRTKLLFSRS